MDRERTYVCIDLKTFYASVECVDRGLDPFTARLVVADPERGRGTICLAVTPALKALGIRNRCRLFEIPPSIGFQTVLPRMGRYMQVSADVYGIYLRYVSPEDMHVYSIDECFIDATPYLGLYGMDSRGFARMLMNAVRDELGLCATAGIGPNLFLAKVALDITAKHDPHNIGVLDEEEFKRTVWHHRPITDIWNIGPGIARRLETYGVRDLFGICWLDEDVLYREFGINARYLIDHAHGIEPCTIAQIHAYKPKGSSMTNGQILPCGYRYEEGLTVLKEMVDASTLELVEKGLATGSVGLHVGYAVPKADRGAFLDNAVQDASNARHTGGSRRLTRQTASFHAVLQEAVELYASATRRDCDLRRITLTLGSLVPEACAAMDLFSEPEALSKERRVQEAVLAVKRRFGKNSLLKGINFAEYSTGRERNEMIGGHHA